MSFSSIIEKIPTFKISRILLKIEKNWTFLEPEILFIKYLKKKSNQLKAKKYNLI